MRKPAIVVKNLSKSYRVGTREEQSYRTLRDTLIETARAPLRRFRELNVPKRDGSDTFWAVNDVSFEVQPGEVVGIIGRNGAGKSTLLKILSRITQPTRGRVTLRGRVASLLEVGTGFHPELTGRENIYLNGSILGMKRGEISKKFDEIVAFAEIEKFLDTPVKRYSSGMYVRLAFAVAAHLEPEILVVDEVLAVGDAEFQAKCLGKMREVSRGQGRTVLFVSHNLGAVVQLCSRAVLLERGALVADQSDVAGVVEKYLGSGEGGRSNCWAQDGVKISGDEFDARRFYVAAAGSSEPAEGLLRDRMTDVVIEGQLHRNLPDLCLGYALYSGDGTLLYWSYQTDLAGSRPVELEPGPVTLRSALPVHLLNHGEYRLELIGGRHGKKWFFEPGVSAPQIFVTVSGRFGDSPLWQCKRPGLLAPALEWTCGAELSTELKWRFGA